MRYAINVSPLQAWGGVGGTHLLTLTRLGIGSFNIADMDSFEIANFNRQVGASMSSIDKPKVDVMSALAISRNCINTY